MLVAVALATVATNAFAQDQPANSMFLTEYLRVLPGHYEAFSKALTNHNKIYHASGPKQAYAYYVMTGIHTGLIATATGPMTFTDLDAPQVTEGHGADWMNNILPHARDQQREFWVSVPDLSIVNDDASAPKPFQRVRYFDVADYQFFVKVQGMIKKIVEADGPTTDRVMYRREGAHSDGRDWALVSGKDSWSQLDERPSTSFRERFDSVFGAEAWEQFGIDIDAAIVSRDDEYWSFNAALSGMPATNE